MRYTTKLTYSFKISGPLAQLVEQLTFNQWVAGSNPARLTTITKSVHVGTCARGMRDAIGARRNQDGWPRGDFNFCFTALI